MKILITGHDTFHNKGCQALIFTTTEIMKLVFPKAEFTVFSWEPEYDQNHYFNTNTKCKFMQHRFQVNEFSLRNRLWLKLNNCGIKTDRILRVKPSFYDAIKSSDLMIVSGGDILADYGEKAIKHYFFPIAVALALNKPVYVFAQSISRYKSEEVLRFARSYLNRVSLITVREKVSYEYLKEIGIKSSFYQTADPAFTLQPCTEGRLQEILETEHFPRGGGILIGVSVSETVTRWSGGSHDYFLKIMADVCDRLIDKYKARIVFVPHVSYPDDSSNDDRLVGMSIRSLMSHNENVLEIERDYSCSELKAIISKFTLFIGARTHATIASTSMLVPTIALAYSSKALGIMEDVLDRETCVCDASNLNAEELLKKCEYLIEDREEVVKAMNDNLDGIRKRSYLNGELARNIIQRESI